MFFKKPLYIWEYWVIAMKKLIVIMSVLLLTACSVPTANIQTTNQDKPKENIRFEVISFELKYEDGQNSKFGETYSGTGIIKASGNQELVNKPYLVLVQIKKVSGGDERSTGYQFNNVIVTNGIGRVTTYDWSLDKNIKMERPVYELKVVGYIPYIPNE